MNSALHEFLLLIGLLHVIKSLVVQISLFMTSCMGHTLAWMPDPSTRWKVSNPDYSIEGNVLNISFHLYSPNNAPSSHIKKHPTVIAIDGSVAGGWSNRSCWRIVRWFNLCSYNIDYLYYSFFPGITFQMALNCLCVDFIFYLLAGTCILFPLPSNFGLALPPWELYVY